MFRILLLSIICVWYACHPHNESRPFKEHIDFITFKEHTLILSKHAQCRMACRDISKEEIQFILDNGIVNPRKSRPAPSLDKCPTKAYEGRSPEGQQIRVIIGTCPEEPILITAIDLSKKHHCDCD